jgi:hypothetical protein
MTERPLSEHGRYPPNPDHPSPLETHQHATSCVPMAVALDHIAYSLNIIARLVMFGLIIAVGLELVLVYLLLSK